MRWHRLKLLQSTIVGRTDGSPILVPWLICPHAPLSDHLLFCDPSLCHIDLYHSYHDRGDHLEIYNHLDFYSRLCVEIDLECYTAPLCGVVGPCLGTNPVVVTCRDPYTSVLLGIYPDILCVGLALRCPCVHLEEPCPSI